MAYGDTRLDGLNFSLFADWPGAIHEGNGVALTCLDQRATAEQRAAVQTLLNGEAGPPWSILRATLSTVHGPHPAAYDVSLDGIRSKVQAGRYMQLEMTPIRNPVSGAEVHPRIVLPEGFVWKDGEIASSKTFRVQDGVAFDHSGKYAAVSKFSYAGG